MHWSPPQKHFNVPPSLTEVRRLGRARAAGWPAAAISVAFGEMLSVLRPPPRDMGKARLGPTSVS